MDLMDISFPHLGIYLRNVPKTVTVFGLDIAMYGIVIAAGMLLGLTLAARIAKKTGHDPDTIWDLSVWLLTLSVLGARIYYVIFMWDMYKNDLIQVFNIRGGGLAIYGGIIAGVLTILGFCRIKKINPLWVLDCCAYGLLTGQILGRWGNFFNREVFGEYTDSLLAMRIPAAMVRESDISEMIAAHMVDGCIQVHPTFLYEGLWNSALLIFLLLFLKHKKFDGQIILMYFAGYGIGRALIEYIRTDQLFIPGTAVPVNLVLGVSAFCISVSVILITLSRIRSREKNTIQ